MERRHYRKETTFLSSTLPEASRPIPSVPTYRNTAAARSGGQGLPAGSAGHREADALASLTGASTVALSRKWRGREMRRYLYLLRDAEIRKEGYTGRPASGSLWVLLVLFFS